MKDKEYILFESESTCCFRSLVWHIKRAEAGWPFGREKHKKIENRILKWYDLYDTDIAKQE